MRSAALGEGVERSVSHLQGSEDVLLGIFVERLAAEFFDESAESDEVDIRILEGSAGL